MIFPFFYFFFLYSLWSLSSTHFSAFSISFFFFFFLCFFFLSSIFERRKSELNSPSSFYHLSLLKTFCHSASLVLPLPLFISILKHTNTINKGTKYTNNFSSTSILFIPFEVRVRIKHGVGKTGQHVTVVLIAKVQIALILRKKKRMNRTSKYLVGWISKVCNWQMDKRRRERLARKTSRHRQESG